LLITYFLDIFTHQLGKGANMTKFKRFFNLQAMDAWGNVRKATLSEKMVWILNGCKSQDPRLMQRYARLLRHHHYTKGNS